MNLIDSSFICLDIGKSGVRAIAHRIRGARIVKSEFFYVESFDTVFALKSVFDELEKKIGSRISTAYITGNFGEAVFSLEVKNTTWSSEHKITNFDIQNQVAQIEVPIDFFPMHIIPNKFGISACDNLLSPTGYTDRELTSFFASIFYSKTGMNNIMDNLRQAHIQSDSFFDPSLLLNNNLRGKKQTALFIDMGGQFTTVSIWTARGPVFFSKRRMGGMDITRAISSALNIKFAEAEKIKRNVASLKSSEMDRFTPADSAYDFSRSDLNDIILPVLLDTIDGIKSEIADSILRYKPSVIFLSGGGSLISGIDEFIENMFGVRVQNIGTDAAVRALSDSAWNAESLLVKKYLNREKKLHSIFDWFVFKKNKKKNINIPIMPSSLAFNMTNLKTLELFKEASISMLHIDIMDGFFVDKITGGIEQLKKIRKNTNAHLYVHLMTESPLSWAVDAANAGADTIIVSTGTAGVRAALRRIREMGKRCGIALDVDSDVSILKPVIKEIDEILIMSVRTGNGGQEFQKSVLHKISTLSNTRRRYNLKYKITVDGGINFETAKLCWAAGADYLVSGSYLARSESFDAALQSLLPKE